MKTKTAYVCQKCGEVGELFHGPGGETLAEEFAITFLGKIPFDPRMAVAGDQGIPFVADYEESFAARTFSQVAERFQKALS